VLLIQPPPGLVSELAAALPIVGAALATHNEWSARLYSAS
jgi:hypothetical protein